MPEVCNPGSPCIIRVGHLQPGRDIHIHGKVHEGCDVFAIALQDHENDSKMPLYLSLRVHERMLVINDRHDYNWGQEERGPLNLHHHEHFRVHIHCEGDHFKIKLFGDGHEEEIKFHYRHEIHKAEFLAISGNINVEKIEF